MSTPVLLVLGAGPKIGLAVANSFAAKGYKVALAARSLQEGVGEDGFLRIKADFENAERVRDVFAKVRKELGIPSVVVYNGMSSSCILLLRYDGGFLGRVCWRICN
jgi:NAD(P)-dependent dehydrogenase (short-subunit alcohol dehydrogenase family)